MKTLRGMKRNSGITKNSIRWVKQILAFAGFATFNLQIFGGPSPLVTNKPTEIPNNAEYKRGLLNVTHFGAIPDDGLDDTDEIQAAVDTARDFNLVAYFPTGTYEVSDQIIVTHVAGERTKCIFVEGEKGGTRPVIKLSGQSGFNNASNPKAMFTIMTMKGGIEKENSGYSNIIKGIDFDITSSSNNGAIAIKFSGAQGCTIEDVRIDATGAFAGLQDSLGVQGGYYNLEVEGGKHVLSSVDGVCLSPVFVGCRFFNQDSYLFNYTTRSPIPVVGFHIKKQNGPVFKTFVGHKTGGGTLSLVDGIIELANNGLLVDNEISSTKSRTIYMKDVYAYKANDIMKRPDGTSMSGTPNGWTKIEEYSWCQTGISPNAETYVNGVKDGNGETSILDTNYAGGNVPDVSEIFDRHIWNDATFPHWSDADTYDAVADGGLDNSGGSDVTSDLQQIIDNNGKVFLPKGIYKVSDTITLRSNTQLFGIARTITIIEPDRNWDQNTEKYLFETVDDINGTTVLAFLWTEHYIKPSGGDKLSLLHWRVGRNSMVRDTFSWCDDKADPFQGLNLKFVKFSGSGGGRMYSIAMGNYAISDKSGHANFRCVFVDGTSEPLNFYGFNMERWDCDAMAEFKNASNIGVYGSKTEALNELSHSVVTAMWINNCDNVIIAAHAGVRENAPDANIKITGNSTNYVVANANAQGNDETMLKEVHFSGTTTVPGNKYVGMFRRGNPTVVGPGGGSSSTESITIVEGSCCDVLTRGESYTVEVNYTANVVGREYWLLLKDGGNSTVVSTKVHDIAVGSNLYASATVTVPTSATLASDYKWLVRLVPDGGTPSTQIDCEETGNTIEVVNSASEGISIVSGFPSVLTQGASYQVDVDYTANIAGREYWLLLKDGGGSTINSTEVHGLAVGSSTASATLLIPSTAALGSDCKWLVRLVPDGGTVSTEIDNDETSNTIQVVSAAVESITINPGHPAQLDLGQTYTVEVDYTANVSGRECWLILKDGSNSTVTSVKVHDLLVGTNNIGTAQLTVPSSTAVGSNYKWLVRLVPDGGTVSTQIDSDETLANISVGASALYESSLMNINTSDDFDGDTSTFTSDDYSMKNSTTSSGNQYITLKNSSSWDDYQICVDMRTKNAFSGWKGAAIKFRDDGSNFYRLLITGSGEMFITRKGSKVNETSVSGFTADGIYNKITIEAVGGNIKVYTVDSTDPYIDYTDPNPFLSGKIGLEHRATESGNKTKFKNLSVWQL